MDINSLKFKELLTKKRHTQISLSKALGIPTTSVNAWVNRGRIPDKHVQKVNEILGINLKDYFNGINLTDELHGGNSIKRIPFYDVDILAGGNEVFNDFSSLNPTSYYTLPGISAELVLPVYGNSMEDKISGGDKIAVKRVIDFSYFNYGTEYVVITETYRLIKQLKKHPTDPQKIILHSYNAEYDDIELPIKKITQLYSVVGILKKTQN